MIECSCAHTPGWSRGHRRQLDPDGELNGQRCPIQLRHTTHVMRSDLRFLAVADLHAGARRRMLHPRAGPAARWAEKDPLAGGRYVGTRRASSHARSTCSEGQKANSEGRVLTSCVTWDYDPCVIVKHSLPPS
jgi:hypothetical protein